MAHTVLRTCTQARVVCVRAPTNMRANRDKGTRLSAAPIQLSLCDVCWIGCSMSCDGHSVQQCDKAPFTSLDSSTEKNVFKNVFFFFLADRFKFFLTHCELSLYSDQTDQFNQSLFLQPKFAKTVLHSAQVRLPPSSDIMHAIMQTCGHTEMDIQVFLQYFLLMTVKSAILRQCTAVIHP